MSTPQRIANIAELELQDGDLSNASDKAMARVTPADYVDGEDTNDKR
jgi:hypothetical protein